MTKEMLQNIITEMKIARDLGDTQDMYNIYKRHILPFLINQVKNLNEEPETIACTHDNTIFQNIRCNVCSDCGVVIEIDV